MIVRGFYSPTRHQVIHDHPTALAERDGCTFRTVVTSVVRTACGQFLVNDAPTVVVIERPTETTCGDCARAERIAAAAAQAFADVDA